MRKSNSPLNIEEVERRFKKKGLKLLEKKYKNNHQLLDCESELGYRYNFNVNELDNVKFNKLVYTRNKWSLYNIEKFIINNNINVQLVSKKYKNSREPLAFRCRCGKVYNSSWDDFQGRRRYFCSECMNLERSKRLDFDFVKKEYQKMGLRVLDGQVYKTNRDLLECETEDGYRVFKSYTNLYKTIKKNIFSYKYNKKNYVYNVNNYLKLNNINSKCIDLFDYKISEKGQYWISLECECGDVFKSCIDYIRTGNYKCSKCYNFVSKGELKIVEILTNNNINFIQQYKFKDCISKRCLPFDFYLPEYNICIEFDGIQHHEAVTHFGGEESFKSTQERDNIKEEYCKNNNIKLIRIPYFELKNIEKILLNELPLRK